MSTVALRGAPAIFTLVLTVLLTGCVVTPRVPETTPTPPRPAVATFTVAGGETFVVELATPALVEHAERLLAGENLSAIPLGTVVRGDPGVNAPWSWHLDPATFEFAFVTIEVCDGLPSDVERQVVTSPQYCPWSAKVTAVDPGGAGPPTPSPAPSATPTPGGLPALARPVRRADGAAYAGIAQVVIGDRCTGTLIDTRVATGPAYLLTNGHCAGGRDAPANAVVRDDTVTGDAAFGMYADAAPDEVVSVPVTSVPYSTMKGSDVSVVRLGLTLAQARDRGLRPVRISATGPSAGSRVTNVGIPVQGTEDWVLRRGSCTLGASVDLLEFSWHFDRSWPGDCPGIRGGSSGSPLLDAGGELVAMINTTTAGADPRGGDCYLGKPCERTDATTRVVADRSYAVGVAGLGRCFDDASGTFALTARCPLDPGTGVSASLDLRAVRPPAAGGAATARVTVTGPAGTRVITKTGPAGTTDCTRSTGYTAPTMISNPLDVQVPAEEGMYLVCVAEPDRIDRAAQVVLQVDRTPPQRDIRLAVTELGEERSFEPIFSVPELSGFMIKTGPDGTDCDDPDGYRVYRRIPTLVAAAELPAVVCVIGEDEAGNVTPPYRQVLTRG